MNMGTAFRPDALMNASRQVLRKRARELHEASAASPPLQQLSEYGPRLRQGRPSILQFIGRPSDRPTISSDDDLSVRAASGRMAATAVNPERSFMQESSGFHRDRIPSGRRSRTSARLIAPYLETVQWARPAG
jgi:hypothetical protein